MQTKEIEGLHLHRGALELKSGKLIARLDKGAAIIEGKKIQGIVVSDLEDYWIQLLRNYEKVSDEIRAITRQITAKGGRLNEPIVVQDSHEFEGYFKTGR